MSAQAVLLTESLARTWLRTRQGAGGLELWIADQEWTSDAGGWEVAQPLGEWRFRIEPVAASGLMLWVWHGVGSKPATTLIIPSSVAPEPGDDGEGTQHATCI